MIEERSVMPIEKIEKAILQIAGKKIMLDSDGIILVFKNNNTIYSG